MTQRDAQKGLKQGVSVGIGTRNVIAFRCRERYFGEISGLNRRSISIATSTSRSAHTHMVFACQSESPYDEMLPEQRIRYPSAPKIGETREISTPSLPSLSPPSLHSGCVLYVGHVSVGDTKGDVSAPLRSFSGSTEEIGRTRMGANSDVTW